MNESHTGKGQGDRRIRFPLLPVVGSGHEMDRREPKDKIVKRKGMLSDGYEPFTPIEVNGGKCRVSFPGLGKGIRFRADISYESWPRGNSWIGQRPDRSTLRLQGLRDGAGRGLFSSSSASSQCCHSGTDQRAALDVEISRDGNAAITTTT
eukprot:Gb_02794 [translate_table: standard]